MHTRTANIGAYQVEKQVEVGVAGAEALGQMGVNGARTLYSCECFNGSDFIGSVNFLFLILSVSILIITPQVEQETLQQITL